MLKIWLQFPANPLIYCDASKAKAGLEWQPKYDLPALVKEMVQADIDLFEREKLLSIAGYIKLKRG